MVCFLHASCDVCRVILTTLWWLSPLGWNQCQWSYGDFFQVAVRLKEVWFVVDPAHLFLNLSERRRSAWVEGCEAAAVAAVALKRTAAVECCSSTWDHFSSSVLWLWFILHVASHRLQMNKDHKTHVGLICIRCYRFLYILYWNKHFVTPWTHHYLRKVSQNVHERYSLRLHCIFMML